MEYHKKDNIILNEIFRKIGYFHNWYLNTYLLIVLYPSEAKRLKEKGLIRPVGDESKYISSWYNLTEKGKDLFKPITQNRKRKIGILLNEKMFLGKQLIDFNKL